MARKRPASPAKDSLKEELDREEKLFIQEVNEELKQEQYTKLWKRYGRYFVGVAAIVLVAVAGWQYWRGQQRSAHEATSVQFAAAVGLAAEGKTADASKLLAKIAREADGGYRALAHLRRAALLAKEGEIKAAAGEYDALANDADAPQVLRELGTVMWALTALDSADPKTAKQRLKPLTDDKNAWKFSALELSALYAERAGQHQEARGIFTRLSKDSRAPSTIRSRAREMLAIMGGS